MSSTQDGLHVMIGLGEIYDKVVTLSGKVDQLLAHREDSVKDLADHETRIRLLEKARWPLPALAAIVSVAALVVSLIKQW